MKRVAAIEIIATTARHFGVNPRKLSLAGCMLAHLAPYHHRKGWSRVDEARAVALYVVRSTIGTSDWRLARLLDHPNTSHFQFFLRTTLRDVEERVETDELLQVAVADIETELASLEAARAETIPASATRNHIEARAV
jgi:hypothetical protein